MVNCLTCGGNTIPKQTTCPRPRKAGFRAVLMVHCAIVLNADTIADFLSGAAVPIVDGAAGVVGSPIVPALTTELTIQEAIDFSLVGYLGLDVIGGLTKSNTTKQKLSSCKPEEITSNTWDFKATFKKFDVSGLNSDCNLWNRFIQRSGSQHLVFLRCDYPAEAFVLTAGSWTLSDVDLMIGEDSLSEVETRSFTASYESLAIPCTYPFPSFDSLTL